MLDIAMRKYKETLKTPKQTKLKKSLENNVEWIETYFHLKFASICKNNAIHKQLLQ